MVDSLVVVLSVCCPIAKRFNLYISHTLAVSDGQRQNERGNVYFLFSFSTVVLVIFLGTH